MTDQTSSSPLCCSSDIAASIDRLPALKHLSITGGNIHSNLKIESRSLKSLTMKSQRMLTELEVNCGALKSFELKPICQGLSAAHALTSLTIRSHRLDTLCIPSCPSLKEVTLRCPNLTGLEIHECARLRSRVFDVLASGSACPNLKSITVRGCHKVTSANLRQMHLCKATFVDCKMLQDVRLQCPQVKDLVLSECGELGHLDLHMDHVRELDLGKCQKLSSLSLNAKGLEQLVLRGCNELCEVKLACPLLHTLDASLCSSLTDGALHALSACPSLRELQLGNSVAITATGMGALSVLGGLRSLDLACMAFTNLAPLVPICTGLSRLVLRDGFALGPEGVEELVSELHTLRLEYLDVSHCCVPVDMAPRFVTAPGVKHLTLDGLTAGAHADSGALWPLLNQPDAQSDLEELRMGSLPGANFYLGMAPVAEVEAQGLTPAHSVGDAPGWVHLPTPLRGLKHLRLAGRSFESLGLCLPELRTLKVDNCQSLANIALRCPALKHLDLSACRMLSLDEICAAVRRCPSLELLDARLCPAMRVPHAVSAVQAACPSLHCIRH